MEKINVEEIMEQIRIEIKEKGYSEESLDFGSVDIPKEAGYYYNNAELKSLIGQMNAIYYVPHRYPVTGNPVTRFIKKVIRVLISFVIKPISANQNEFNANVTRSFNQMVGYVEQQNEIIQQYEKNLELLEAKIRRLENRLDEK